MVIRYQQGPSSFRFIRENPCQNTSVFFDTDSHGLDGRATNDLKILGYIACAV
jgi:hypothetical protein